MLKKIIKYFFFIRWKYLFKGSIVIVEKGGVLKIEKHCSIYKSTIKVDSTCSLSISENSRGVLVLLMLRAHRCSLPAASIWFRIKESRGEISRVGPLPLSRISLVARKYTMLFPQPVRSTTRSFLLFRRCSMLSHCCS